VQLEPRLTVQQTHSDTSGASNAPGRASARHSLPKTSGLSVVQNGTLSASLNRLSHVARNQLSSPSLSNARVYINMQGAPAN